MFVAAVQKIEVHHTTLVIMEDQEMHNTMETDNYVCGECFQLFPSMEYFNYHHCTPLKDSTCCGHNELSYIEESLTSLDEKDYGGTETEAAVEKAVASILEEKNRQLGPERNSSSLTFNESTIELNHVQQSTTSVSYAHVENSMGVPGPYQPMENTRNIVQFERSQIDSCPVEYVEQSIEHLSIVDHQEGPVVEHIVENVEPTLQDIEQMHIGPANISIMESVEIPSSNVYIYDNPVYLNRLMKDNTCGKRMRYDAPYIHRLGPWDDKSSRQLISLVKEYPEAYFIWGKNCKRTEAWELIRYKLGKAGYHFTVLQIRMRWRELCKRYRNVVNHNDLHNTRRTCQYFDDLNSLFGIWDSQATLLLIKEIGANPAKRLGQSGGTRMRYKVWKQVQEALSQHGYEYTAHQVHGRWTALVTLYQRMAEHNSNHGNELLTVAYQDAIETVFKYVPERKTKLAKIREKQGQSCKEFQKKWTVPVERILLRGYKDNIELFMKNENKKEVWEKIVMLLKEEGNYHTNVEKVRTRIYELFKQYEAVLRHNSQPGTLYRESRHHQILADIYSCHNCWPHDGSTMKSDNSSSLRMRQMKAQMLWSDEESRAVLSLYPQVLFEHLRKGDQLPLEELWVQLAKDLVSTHNFFKQPYEIEEHIALLRQGYKSQNPFPFQAEMELLEETEQTLCFSPESTSPVIAQAVQYWSYSAAHCLLSFVIHYCQEGVKLLTENLFVRISDEMESLGYKYTTKECRQYYHLLKKIYKKKVEALKEGKDIYQHYPYMEKMQELETVLNQTEFTDDVFMKVVRAASSSLEEIKVADERSKRKLVEKVLVKLKMHLMQDNYVHPLPSVKAIALILLKFLKEKSTNITQDACIDSGKITSVLLPYMDILTLISQNGLQSIHQESQRETVREAKIKKQLPPKSGSIQWTSDNICIMLDTVKEWQLLCHDNNEVEAVRAGGQPLWNEVAYKLSRRIKKCPDVCQRFFVDLCHEYAEFELSEATKVTTPTWYENKKNRDLLHTVVSPVGSCDAEFDTRDVWWVSEAGGWSTNETLELLFTVRELWTAEPSVDWKSVSLLMKAGGHQREAKCCYIKFHHLYSGYQTAYAYNRECSIRERRRPPFYFKIHSLFGYQEIIPGYESDSKTNKDQDLDVDEQEVIEILLAGLKDMKNLAFHSVPRLPLLLSLAHFLDDQYQHLPYAFTPYQVWHLLVQLHHAQRETVQEACEGPFGADLDGLWQDHSSPLMAYGFHAVPVSGWQSISDWSEEELNMLVKTSIEWKLNSPEDMSVSEVYCEAVQSLNKTIEQGLQQWHYMVNVLKHGGYCQYKDNINLVDVLQTHSKQHVSVGKSKESKAKFCEKRKDSYSAAPQVSSHISQNTSHHNKKVSPKSATNNKSVIERENFSISLLKSSQDFELSDTTENIKSSSEIPDDFTTEGKLKNITVTTNETVNQKCTIQLGMTNTSEEKNEIQVEVLSITENDDSKVIMCQVDKGQQKRIIKLKYPARHPFPVDIKYIKIPRTLIEPSYITLPGEDSPELRTKKKSRASSYGTSGSTYISQCKIIPQCIKNNLEDEIQRDFSLTPQKWQLCESLGSQTKRLSESSVAQVKKTRQELSLLHMLRKRESSKLRLMLNRGSQLQLKKSREFLHLPPKNKLGEVVYQQTKSDSIEPPRLPFTERLGESSDVPLRKLIGSSQKQVKKPTGFFQSRLQKNCMYLSQVKLKNKKKRSFILSIQERSEKYQAVSKSQQHKKNLRKGLPDNKNSHLISHSKNELCTGIVGCVRNRKRKAKQTVNEQRKTDEHKMEEETPDHKKKGQGKTDTINLLSQYHLQCEHEKERLTNICQENYQEETSTLYNIMSLIKEIKSKYGL
nr:uncharacterized protein LOC128686166 isoform X2 [Cherax quadricarinatus]